MTTVRPFAPKDLNDLYAICLATGDYGEDAGHLYKDPMTPGQVYAAPYGVLCPETCLVVEDDEGIGGYAVGTVDTSTFEASLEERWWPLLRATNTIPDRASYRTWAADEHFAWLFHHPSPTPGIVSSHFPAHLHMNLLPRLRSNGVGTRLFQAWGETAEQAGAKKVHICADRANKRGISFWSSCGFRDLTSHLDLPDDDDIWMGRAL